MKQLIPILVAAATMAFSGTAPCATVIKDLQFDTEGVLPSSEPDIEFFTNFSVPEGDVYTAAGGLLQQRTFGLGTGSASYSFPDNNLVNGMLDPGLDTIIEARVRVVRFEGAPPEIDGGAFFQAFDGAYRYTLLFEESGVMVLGSNIVTPVDIFAFHTYRLQSWGSSGFVQLFIDDVLAGIYPAPVSNLNGFDFGDGVTPSGNNADADWDFVRVVQDILPRATASWEASTGLFPSQLPDDSCGYWEFVANGSPPEPLVSNGVLTTSTNAISQRQIFFKSDPAVALPETLVIESRVRILDHQSSSDNRAGTAIGFSRGSSRANNLQLATGEIWLSNSHGDDGKGPTAQLDTSLFHTYRIRVVGDDITIFVDGDSTLAGSMYSDGPEPATALFFGHPSFAAYGSAEWLHIEHNAWVQECPPPSPCVDLVPDLLSWWTGDHSRADVIGTNNAELFGSVGFGPGKVAGPFHDGRGSAAFAFDGGDGHIEIPDASTLRPPVGVTVEAWVRADRIPDGIAIHIVDKHSVNPSGGYQLGLSGSLPVFLVETTNGRTVQFASVGIVGDTRYHHLVGTYDGTQVSLFVDGVLAGSTPATGDIIYPVPTDLWLGANQQPSPDLRRLAGLLDEVKIYGRALTASEVLEMFDAGGSGGCKVPPVAVEDPPVASGSRILAQNKPNPFNPRTEISFTLPAASPYDLAIYDTAGRMLRRYQGTSGTGTTSLVWDGKDHRGDTVSSGVYYYRLRSSEYVGTRQMALIR